MDVDKQTNWQVYDDLGRRKYVREEEGHQFLAAADALQRSERALCRVLSYTGCRVSEALGLHRHHLDAAAMTLTIKTLKRRREVFRVVPIPAALVEDLLALPVATEGRFWTIHRATAWRLVKRVMEGCDLRGPMACCKGLRHGFGMKAARHRIPENLIQRWMGHSSRTTTSIYLDAVGSDERDFAARMW